MESKIINDNLNELENDDFWDELGKEQKEAIDKAIQEADESKLKAHKEVMKKLKTL